MSLAFALIPLSPLCSFFFFFFNDTATTEIYTLSLHDALPISRTMAASKLMPGNPQARGVFEAVEQARGERSEEHTSELQSRSDIVCRVLHDTPTTVTYTLSLHDALPVSRTMAASKLMPGNPQARGVFEAVGQARVERSEEHTSELQSRSDLVCRLLL